MALDMLREAAARIPGLKKNGKEYLGLCPFHQEKTPSFRVYNDHYHCYGCGAHGDVYDFVSKMDNIKLGPLLSEHGIIKKDDMKNNRVRAPKVLASAAVAARPTCPSEPPAVLAAARADNGPAERPKIVPEPERLKVPVGMLPKNGEYYVYTDEDGVPDFYVCKATDPSGKKKFWQISFVDGVWQTGLRPGLRPLFNIKELAERPDAEVVVVEGEKAAEAAKRLFPEMVAVTWQGGAAAVEKTDFSPLFGRRTVICPDKDEPGEKAADLVARILTAGGAIVKMFDAPADADKGWDWADFHGDAADAKELLAKNSYDEYTPPETGFRLLGRSMALGKKIEYVFFVPGYGVANYQATEITAKTLMALHPSKDFWANFSAGRDPFSRRGGEEVLLTLATISESLPIFENMEVRGAGVWSEGGRPALNDGESVYFRGRKYKGGCIIGRSVYVCGPKKKLPPNGNFDENDRRATTEVFLNAGFRSQIEAKLVAGWMAAAPVCGMLEWRSHVWITGNAGSGKSWLLNFISSMLGDGKVVVQSDMTTEAGLRQATALSALPILFDEADVAPERHQAFQHVVALARASSSPDSPKIVKGTQTGRSTPFHAKSSFLFSSIVPQLVHEQDKSRFFVAELKNPEEWDSTARARGHAVCERNFFKLRRKADQFFGFVFQNGQKIVEEAKECAEMLLDLGIKAREADLVAPLVAGWCLLSGQDKYSVCLEYNDFRQEEQKPPAHRAAAEYLLSFKIDGTTFTVGKALETIDAHAAPAEYKDSARNSLRMLGIDYDGQHVYVVYKCRQLDKLFAGTEYERNYMDVLSRTPDAKRLYVRRMWGGKPCRCLMLPNWLNL